MKALKEINELNSDEYLHIQEYEVALISRSHNFQSN